MDRSVRCRSRSIRDFCSEAGSYYLIMEWVEGVDLGTLIRVYRDAVRDVPWPVAVTIAIGTLRGLGAAHDRVTVPGTRRRMTPQPDED